MSNVADKPDSTFFTLDDAAWSDLKQRLGEIVAHSGIRLRFPADYDHTLETTLAAVAAESDTPIHRIELPPQWHRSDHGPLLTVRESDGKGQMVALIPKRRGGYWICDGTSSEKRRLTEHDAAGIGPWAWIPVRTLENISAKFTDSGLPDAGQGSVPVANSMGDLAKFAIELIRGRIALVVLCVVCSIALSFVIPLMLKQVIDTALPVADERLIATIVALLVALNVAQAMVVLMRSLSLLRTQAGVTETLQTAVWWRVLNLPVSFFRGRSSGEIVHRSMIVANTGWQLGAAVFEGGISALVAVSNVAVAAWLSPQLLAFAIPLAFGEAIVLCFVLTSIRKRSLGLESRRARVTGTVASWTRGIIKVKSTATESVAAADANATYDPVVSEDDSLQFLEDIRGLLGIAIPAVGTLIIFAVGFEMASAPGTTLSLGSFAAFITAYRTFASGTTGVANVAAELLGARARLTLVAPFLETQSESQLGKTRLEIPSGGVEFDRVSFHYPANAKAGVTGATFQVRPGQLTGLLGKSGSGKSTLIRLLLGFEIPDQGTIRIDGIDLRTLDLRQIRRHVGCVLQSAKLLHGSIRENIACGREVTQQQIEEALRIADLDSLIQQMPMGLETLLSQGGGNLSGGQAQRLLLARAIAHQPKFLVLDEALSGLDVSQQRRILDRLRQLDMTILMISHRADAMVDADLILEVERGIVRQIRFDELEIDR